MWVGWSFSVVVVLVAVNELLSFSCSGPSLFNSEEGTTDLKLDFGYSCVTTRVGDYVPWRWWFAHFTASGAR